MLDTAFVTFLETDKNASARYRAGDVTVVDEFVNMFRTGVIVPANRPVPNNNGLPPRRPQPAGPPRLPRGGPGSTVVGQQPQQPNRANAAEVHEAAADAYFAARG
jgi:hypothetical protein